VTGVAFAFSAAVLVIVALLRAGGASLVRTPRADAARDATEGHSGASIVADLLEDRPRLQPALGASLTVLMVIAAVPAAWAFSRVADGWALSAWLLVLSLVLVLGGDLLPRVIGRDRPGRLAYRLSPLLRSAIAFGAAAADLLAEVDEDTEEAVEEEEESGGADERELISSVLDFTDTIVREVMTPRTDMISVFAAASTDDALDIVLAEGRSRIPVLGDGLDDIQGVLYARDLLQLMDDEADAVPSSQIMRPAYFVPETKKVPELLREMQSNQVHLAIVVDEFGGTAGIVTIEDLLEEIVGEIVDEYDQEEPMYTALDDGELLVDGRLGVDELGELLGVDLPDDEWDTVGGLMLGLAGRVPAEGEAFELDRHVFVADRVQGRRVARVRLRSR
jgi:CBS domain containing-hemolysin-like protein